ncbi:MAG: hypothetical protein WBE82_20295 [Xanthobacteraceae bacterium]
MRNNGHDVARNRCLPKMKAGAVAASEAFQVAAQFAPVANGSMKKAQKDAQDRLFISAYSQL